MSSEPAQHLARSESLGPARGWLWLPLSILLAAPLLLAALPPVADYPNHLARAYALAHLPQDPVLARIFAPQWRILPNLAIDLMLWPLARLLPIAWAGRLVLAAALLLPLWALALYHRARFGRPSLWPLGAAVFAYNGVFLLGLLNFLLAVAAAFATAALWLVGRERAPAATLLGTAAGAVVVFFCHLTGLGLLAVLLLACELDHAQPGLPRPGRLAVAAAAFLPAAALYAASPTAGAGGEALWVWGLKPLFLLAPLTNYDYGLDLASALCLAALLAVALRQGWLVMPRGTAVAAALLAAVALLAPYRLKGGAFLDYRFALPAGLMLFAGVRTGAGAEARACRLAQGVLAALFVLRLAALVDVWRGQPADLAAIQGVVAPVAPGARVLVATISQHDAPAYWAAVPRRRTLGGVLADDEHLPALELIRRGAYFQTFFADPTQQPIAVLPPYRASAPDGASWGAPGYALLGAAVLTPDDARRFPYLVGWWRKFDYVLVMNAGALADARGYLPACLELLRAADVAALYRVRPGLAVEHASDCAATAG